MPAPVKEVEPLTEIHEKVAEILDYLATGSFISDSDQIKLDGVEDGATADQTGAEIKIAYEAEADTNAFSDANVAKLDGIEEGATADQTAVEILALGFVDTTTDQSVGGNKTFNGVVAGPFLGRVINAANYGLREAATAAVNTAALAAAAAALRAALSGVEVLSEQYFPAVLRIPPGEYNVAAGAGNVCWDLTNIRSGPVYLECAGAVFLADATLADKTMVDLVGSRWFRGHMPELRAFDKVNPPAIGLQLGRRIDAQAADEHHLDDLSIRGYFTRAAVYNGASEVCVFTHPVISNYLRTATSYAWIQDGRNTWLPITDADITGLTLNTAQPFNLNTFLNGTIRKSGYDVDTDSYGTAVGSAMWISRASNHSFLNTYFVASKEAAVVLASDAFGFRNLRFVHSLFESSIDHIFHLAVVEGTAWNARGFTIETGASNAVVSVFKVDAALTSAVFHNLNLTIRSFGTAPTTGIFDVPSKVSITSGLVRLPNLTHWVAIGGSMRADLVTEASVEHHGTRSFKGTASDFEAAPTVGVNNTVMHQGRGLANQTITLADDTATAVALPADCDQFILAISGTAAVPGGAMIWVRAAVDDSVIMSQSAARYEILNNVALTGISGTDERVTLGVEAGVLYLENRLGGSRTFALSFLANR